MTHILAIDLGKFKSVACDYDTTTHQHTFTTIPTTPQAVHDLVVERLQGRKKGTGTEKGTFYFFTYRSSFVRLPLVHYPYPQLTPNPSSHPEKKKGRESN